MAHKEQTPSGDGLPKSFPPTGLVGLGGPGLMLFLKGVGIDLPMPIVWLVGIVSIAALLVAGFQLLSWVWHHSRRIIQRARENMIPVLLGATAFAGVLLLIVAGVGTFIYLKQRKVPEQKVAQNSEQVQPVPERAEKGIVWDKNYFLRARTVKNGVEFYGFQLTGWNNTSKFLGNLGGYVRSEKNGRTFPIRLQHQDKLIAPDGYGIPAGHQFHIGAEFMDHGGFSGPQFAAEYGMLTFEFEYDGTSFKHVYSEDEVLKEIARVEEFLKPQPIKSVAGFKKLEESKPKEKTNPHDVPKKLSLIDDEIIPLLRDGSEIDRHIKQGRLLLNNWKTALEKDHPAYLDQLLNYEHRQAGFFDEIEQLRKKNSHFTDISDLLEIPNSTYNYKETITKGFPKFKDAILAVGSPPYTVNINYFLTPIIQDFSSGLANLDGWRKHTETELITLRKKIASEN